MDLQYAWIWYGLEDEDAVSLLGNADFGNLGLPGLSWNGGVWYSDHARGYTGFRRVELTNMLSYRFSGPLQGLSLSWLNSIHRSRGELDNINRTANPVGSAMLERKDVNRLYLTWSRTF
ncbi:OprD family outer membrane porin [Oceanimonas doudoroffii]|nr:OprD family outer membrane porin [Oceanimonas doudoroffii]